MKKTIITFGILLLAAGCSATNQLVQNQPSPQAHSPHQSSTSSIQQLGDQSPSALTLEVLSGKKITETCEPTEWGILLPGGRLPLVWPIEGGISEPQKDHAVAKWGIKDGKLYINGSPVDDGIHGDFTWATAFDGKKYLREYTDNCGLEIGDSFNPEWNPKNDKYFIPQELNKTFVKYFPDLNSIK